MYKNEDYDFMFVFSSWFNDPFTCPHLSVGGWLSCAEFLTR
jgi:hypothetical protein